jgi:hypothetical protein
VSGGAALGVLFVAEEGICERTFGAGLGFSEACEGLWDAAVSACWNLEELSVGFVL